jgi:hypothetical protein
MDKKRFILEDADCLGAIYRLSESGLWLAGWLAGLGVCLTVSGVGDLIFFF